MLNFLEHASANTSKDWPLRLAFLFLRMRSALQFDPAFNTYVPNGSSWFNDDLNSFFKLFQNDFQIKEY